MPTTMIGREKLSTTSPRMFRTMAHSRKNLACLRWRACRRVRRLIVRHTQQNPDRTTCPAKGREVPMSQAMTGQRPAGTTVFPVIGAVSFCHLLNDMMQSLLPAIYPILKGGFNLSFAQIGLLTLTYQITASLLQPLIGLYTDRKPLPYSLPVGMGFTGA